MKSAVLLAQDNDPDGYPEGSIKYVEQMPDDFSVPPGYVEMSDTQIDALQNQFENAVRARSAGARLENRKKDKLTYLKRQTKDYIEQRYSAETQRTISLLIGSATVNSDPVSVQRLTSVTEWIGVCVKRYYTARDAVNAATTPDELEGVSLDLSGLSESDPAIDLEDLL
jgi:hypothetical protein